MFKKVLVANRGEVAVRVLRACAELGIATVAVYSEVDRNALHVRYADEAYPIGPAPARDSYLRQDKIIAIAQRSGAEAIHPGYGFLAENAQFGRACAEAGIVFIGPKPETIHAMGDKLVARRTMRGEGIPVVPGTEEEVHDKEEAAAISRALGYPVFIKAAAGGGGKGMRVVRHPDDLEGAIRAAASEAEAAFGNPTLYIEKGMEGVRHVEIQILADLYGNTIYLGERECSIQRRHQKVIEEAPSTALDEPLRQRMGEVAVRAARAANYQSAGTVEFLVDRDKNFYFLEMNTRLQVEHPVTELVTGIDIVIEQLRMANGRRLRYSQKDVKVRGAAIECRVSAEDPYNNFLPSIGRITRVYEPSGPGVRVDSGIYEGFEVSLYYDPLIAKLVVWGETRGQAILRMRRALSEYKIQGIKTTIPFHLQVMEMPSFIGGRIDTAFLERQTALLTEGSGQGAGAQIAAIAAAAIAHHRRRTSFAEAAADRKVEANLWRLAGRRETMRLW